MYQISTGTFSICTLMLLEAVFPIFQIRSYIAEQVCSFSEILTVVKSQKWDSDTLPIPEIIILSE